MYVCLFGDGVCCINSSLIYSESTIRRQKKLVSESDYILQQAVVRGCRISILGDFEKNQLASLQHPDLKIKINHTSSKRSGGISSRVNYLSFCGKKHVDSSLVCRKIRSLLLAFTFFL